MCHTFILDPDAVKLVVHVVLVAHVAMTDLERKNHDMNRCLFLVFHVTSNLSTLKTHAFSACWVILVLP